MPRRTPGAPPLNTYRRDEIGKNEMLPADDDDSRDTGLGRPAAGARVPILGSAMRILSHSIVTESLGAARRSVRNDEIMQTIVGTGSSNGRS